MLSLFRKKSPNHELTVIDLTLNSILEDDYILPYEIKEALLIRGLRANCIPLIAEQRISEWEDTFSIKSIRNTVNRQDWDELIRLVDMRMNVYGNNIEPLIHKIRCLYKIERWQDCIEVCNKLLRIEENDITAIRFIGRCAKNLELFELAEDSYMLILELEENDLDAILSLIRMNYNSRQYDKVIFYSKKVVQIDPDFIQGYRFLSRGYLAIEEYHSAIDVLHELINLNNEDIEAMVDLGRINYTIGKYSESKEILEKVLDLEKDEQRARRTLSLCYDRLKLWNGALKLYREECDFNPFLFSNWEKLINLYYRLNREADAKKCLDLIDDKLDDNLEKFILMYEICMSFYWNIEAEEIIQVLEKRWVSDPGFYLGMISRNIEIGDLTKAQSYLIKGKAFCKGDPQFKILKTRFIEKMNSVNLRWRDIKRSQKSNDVILHSEGSIKNILDIASKVKVRKVKNRNLRTIVISSTMGRGGAERQVVNCLKGLISNDRFKDVRLFCNTIDNSGGSIATYAPEIDEMGVPTDEFSKIDEWDLKYGDSSADLGVFQQAFNELPIKMQEAIRPLYFAFCKVKPDIVHAWQDQTNINVAIAAKMAGVPGIVLFARSLRPDNKTMLHIRTRPYLRNAYKSILRDKKIQFCHNSNAGAISYSEWLGVSSKPFSIIHNGIDFAGMAEDVQSTDIKDIITDIGIPNNAKIIGGIFRLVQEKRPKLWVDSVSKVIGDIENCHAVIIGGGGMENDISAYINDAGLQDRIHLIGQTRQIKAWLDEIDVFLLTSIVEGLPNVLIEAQAFGVPVITTDAGGARDTIVEGVSGFVVDADSEMISEKIIACLNNKEWLQKASIVAIENSTNKFSANNMIETLLQIYLKSIKSHIE